MSLPAPRGTPYRIAFVCLGNICRSPTADVVLNGLLAATPLAPLVDVTSCGTGDWHLGEPMDRRAAAQLAAAGYEPSTHVSKQFDPSWLDRDLVLAMDAKNLSDITGGRGADERVRMFRSFDPLADPDDLDVPDPWYAGDESFAVVIDIVERTSRQIVTELEALLL